MPGTRAPSAFSPLRPHLTIPAPTPTSRWPFTVLTCLLALAGAVLVADRFVLAPDTAPAPRWTAETRAINLSLAGRTFQIPANYIADAAQRQGGTRKRIDLAARLPSLAGFDTTHAPLFRSDSDLLRVWLEETPSPAASAGTARPARTDMREGADFRPGVYPVAGGLFARAFTASSAYASEEIVYDATGLRGKRTTPYAARCQKWNVSEATCLRRVPLAKGLTMTYRFPREKLANWEQMDRSVTQLVQGFMKLAGSTSH
ncbi:hypothetical protein [Breoghania sp.]|uniref:hypothetical protein n=1 Tax=Breoghania sp. TaxID=2065378 RepID=UPI002AA728E1|nr:hypothetical protein [Breoghania sp.]